MIRLVKMTFLPEHISAFEKLFDEVVEDIRNFPGCKHVELLKDIEHPHIYFTRSIWVSTEALESYRKSALFVHTWARTKALFADRAEAWSCDITANGLDGN